MTIGEPLMERKVTRLLIDKYGQKYSDVLGINLETKDDLENFKWFLASVLFGAPINENSAMKTYRCFENHGVLTPEKILETGWQGLVNILDEGGYTRYDFKTSDKLLEVMGNLLTRYRGSLNLIHEQASDPSDLEKRLIDLGKGMGHVTANIFLRELRGLWKKADPIPTPLVILAARNLDIIKEERPEKVLEELKEFWRKNTVPQKTFVNFETALLRLGKDFCRKGKCKRCVLKPYCLTVALAQAL
jgi:endonuclease III